jgi:hypothetical protein
MNNLPTVELQGFVQPEAETANNHSMRRIAIGLALSLAAITGCSGQNSENVNTNANVATSGTEAPNTTTTSTSRTTTSTLAVSTSVAPDASVSTTDFRNFTYPADTCDYAQKPWDVKNGTATQELPDHYSAKLDVKTVEFGDVNGGQKPEAVILNDCALVRTSSKQLVSIYTAEGTEVKRIGLINVPESKLATNASVDPDGSVRVHEFNGSSSAYNLDGTPKEQPTTTIESTSQPNSANKISVDGIGSLQVGMDLSEVQAKGYTVEAACGPYKTIKSKDGSSMMARITEDDHVVGLSVDSPSFSTLSNVKVGDPESLVSSTYGKNSTVTSDPDYPGNKIYRFASPQAKENNVEIIFYVSGTLKTISLVAVGGQPLFC